MKRCLRVGGMLGLAMACGGCLHALERRELSWESVTRMAEESSRERYEPPRDKLPEEYTRLGYDEYRRIRFRREETIWAVDGLPFHLQFFHRGYLFPESVEIFEFSRTHIQDIPFQARFFDYDGLDLPPLRGAAANFAGFRLNAPFNEPGKYDEVISFIGASYFRALGRGNHYGLSARGLAVGTEGPGPEEFPAFTRFWLQKPLGNSTNALAYAMLEGPSVSGAYRFTIIPGAPTRVDVDAVLFPREGARPLGLAPLTSMFWFSEHSQPKPNDYRTEVHDSDGMFLRLPGGEDLWRPLAVGPQRRHSLFRADNPVAFGLFQRDRDFESYQDLEAHYHSRPSVKIIPRGTWGPGTLHLLEIPPSGEFYDNIVLWWAPEKATAHGESLSFSYTMLWGDPQPGGPLLRAGPTRRGQDLQHPSQTRFMIDFEGPETGKAFDALAVDASATGPARVVEAKVLRGAGQGQYRVSLLIAAEPAEGDIELRATLRAGETAVSETWSYRWSR